MVSRTLLIVWGVCLSVMTGLGLEHVATADEQVWRQLPALPDAEGFAGMFAGVVGERLVVAGGANFPEARPWEGGRKVWYDSIFSIDRSDGVWQCIGRLPRRLGYGVSATYRQQLLCVGGSDSEQHFADGFRLRARGPATDWKLEISPLPALPVPIANGCGALVGESLYVAGGQERPDSQSALRRLFRLDLSAPQPAWHELPPWPGSGRILATAAAVDGEFWIMGGAELTTHDGRTERRYLSDGFRYSPRNGWRALPQLPHPLVAAPSPAPVWAGGPLLVGGDDGTQVGALPADHRGFSSQVLWLKPGADRWESATGRSGLAATPAPRVTVPCTRWRSGWVIPSGEQRPGIRSPQVWMLDLRD